MKHAALLIAVNPENQVLLQHKDATAPNNPNMWCLFGGGIEEGENPKKALRRELMEELEWNINGFKHFLTNESNSIRREVFLLKTERTAADLKATLHEGDDLGFFLAQDIKTIPLVLPHLLLVEEYFRQYELETPANTNHTDAS